MLTWFELAAILLTSLSAAGLGVFLLLRLTPRSAGPSAAHGLARHLDTPRLYRFRNAYLVDRPEGEDPFLEAPDDRASAWLALSDALTRLNPEVARRMQRLLDRGESFALTGPVGPDTLAIGGRPEGEDLVISVALDAAPEGKRAVGAAVFSAMEAELDRLRQAGDASPCPIWVENPQHEIVWANEAYLTLLETPEGGGLAWPLPRLFAAATESLPETGGSVRARPAPEETEPDPAAGWFEVSAFERTGEHLFVARPVSRLVAAEAQLRKFTQTLTKTFADLNAGLAIFDRDRVLVLFNPALVTVTQLPVDLLSSRPRLHDFLDHLRERQRIPEPKDYKEWRRQLMELEQAAEEGDYTDLWTLADGQTLRVTGRPHPDGAIAFHFEDITAEMSLTREFRAELDLYRQVLDRSDAAIAVFDADGHHLLSNGPFRRMWGIDPDASFGAFTVRDAEALWREGAEPTPVWGEVRDFLTKGGERAEWGDRVTARDGTPLDLRLSPISGGATLVAFRPRHSEQTAPEATVSSPAPFLRANRA